MAQEEVGVPTYQYACTEPECGHQFEAVQSFSDRALTDCPACAGRLRKVFSPVGVVFKGSGFYRTDSRAGAAKSENGNGSTPAKTDSTAPAAPSSGSSSGGRSSKSTGSSGSGARTAAAG